MPCCGGQTTRTVYDSLGRPVGSACTCGSPSASCSGDCAEAGNSECLSETVQCSCVVGSSGQPRRAPLDCIEYCGDSRAICTQVSQLGGGAVCACPTSGNKSDASVLVFDGKLSVDCGAYGATSGTPPSLTLDFGAQVQEISCSVINTGQGDFRILTMPAPGSRSSGDVWLAHSLDGGYLLPNESLAFTISVDRGSLAATGDYSSSIEISARTTSTLEVLQAASILVRVEVPLVMLVGEAAYVAENGNVYAAVFNRGDTTARTVPISFSGIGDRSWSMDALATTWLSITPTSGEGDAQLSALVTDWNDPALSSSGGINVTIDGVKYRGTTANFRYSGGVKHAAFLAERN